MNHDTLERLRPCHSCRMLSKIQFTFRDLLQKVLLPAMSLHQKADGVYISRIRSKIFTVSISR